MDSSVDGATGDATPPVPGLMALRIEPGAATVVDDGAPPGESTTYTAIGTFEDGERDVSADVTWTLADRPELGTLEGGLFTSAGIGGTSRVLAAAGSLSATADLTVRLEVDMLAPEVPPDTPGLFPEDPSGDVSDDPDGPRIIYPSHETMFPRNLERVLYQWRAGGALDRFELAFESDVARVRWYTDTTEYLPDAAGWRWLAETHAGSSVDLTVRGLSSAAPDTVYRSQTITLYFSRTSVIGALYYWSTGAQGVMKARISAPIATKFFTDPAGDDDTCVACHTVSRNGQKLSAGYGGERLREIDVADRSVLIPTDPAQDGPEYGWGTFSPDASRLLFANKGRLYLRDADTGADLGEVTLPDGFGAQQPDWSPAGDFVAVAYGPSVDKNKEVKGTSLARIPVFAGDTFGTPEVLVPSADDNDDTVSFPSYSPNSEWIAFIRTTGHSKDNPTGVAYVVESGGGTPIAITRLNERVRDEDGIVEVGNAMPTWAPSPEMDRDVFWLAFSSLRAYGDIVEGRDQLWGAAIDPEVLRSGVVDASYAAFWMPFQDVEEGNHRAFWAIDVEEACPADVEICDGFDNDCDGVVDEMCCTPEEEVCGDGVDNDCDGAADEGCGCGDTEDCENGVDDDCDGLIDGADEDCLI